MIILSLNCGSSSVKAALIDTERKVRRLDLRAENIGSERATVKIGNETRTLAIGSHDAALAAILDVVTRDASTPLTAVAHRVAHGGSRFDRAVIIDASVERDIESLNPLAPLHNPVSLQAIRVARSVLPNVPHIAVFDTAFHATLPARAREYALPRELTQLTGIRRYGFHGTSHAYVAHAAARHLNAQVQDLRVISCHLGSGASVTAIEYGRSVDTSMGMTPLEGLVMGSRAGDVDPGVLLYLLRSGEFDSESLDALLNRRSGLQGLAGTNDMREIESRAAEGDENCRLAINVYAHRVRKYIGAYAAVMGGVDAIAFTAGVGENSALIRSRIAQRLNFLGAILDEDANRDAHVTAEHGVVRISAPESRAHLLVVQADEELSLACEAATLLEVPSTEASSLRIPIAVSARHAHLSQSSIDQLFGVGYTVQSRVALSQPCQFAAEESVSLIGPRGRLEHVRLMGPPRRQDQVEISRSDEFVLGIDAPVRISGDLANTPGITIEGPKGRLTLKSGVICARRHIHMHPTDAERFHVRDRDVVSVCIDGEGRDLIFCDVEVRVSPDYRLEMHLDTDEANAAEIKSGDSGTLYAPTNATATVISTRPVTRFE